MAEEKKYSGYGYHGGGRKATGVKRVTINISGQPEQIARLKELAARENKTVSAFILEKTGVKMNNWFIVNDEGEIIGHDMSEAKAKALAEEIPNVNPSLDAMCEMLKTIHDLQGRNKLLGAQIKKMKSDVLENIRWAAQNKNNEMWQKMVKMWNEWEI